MTGARGCAVTTASPGEGKAAESGKCADLCVRGPRPTNRTCLAKYFDQHFRNRWCSVTGADRVIRWTMAGTVVGVATVAAAASYEHAYALVQVHGEAGWTSRLVPLSLDGLIYASSMVMLDSARRCTVVPALARWLLGLGIVATLAANVAHGLGHGPIGAAVAAWPAIALVGSYELLIMVIRSSQAPSARRTDSKGDADPAAGASSRGVRRAARQGSLDPRDPR